MSSSGFSEVDIEEFDDLVASPLSSPRSRGTLDLSDHHSVDMAPALTPSLPKLTTSSDEKLKEPYVRSTASERSSAAFPPDLSATYKKHERFYFDDGNITFLVEDVLYNVHRYFFCRDSPYFVNLISNRCGDPSISFSQPFVLKDIETEEFDALLRILYPLNFDECEVKMVADWTSVLRLATQWSFTSIRKLTISHLGPIASPVDKIVLGRTYSVNAWLVPGFVAICQRQQPLTRDEGRRLGVDDAVLVACLRESLRACSTKPRAQDITNAVQTCIKSPEIADKGPILFTVSDAPSTKCLHTAIPSDPEPSGSSHSKPMQSSTTDADMGKQLPSISTGATGRVAGKVGTAKGTAKPKSEGFAAALYVPSEVPLAPAEATLSESPSALAPVTETHKEEEITSVPKFEALAHMKPTRAAKPTPVATADAPSPLPDPTEPDVLATGESLTGSFSGLLGTAGKVASGWGGRGGGAKAPAAAPSAVGGWGSPAKTPGWGSTGSSAKKGATGRGSQSKAPAAAGGWGSMGTAAGLGSTEGAEENKNAASWNLLDESKANESNNAGSNKGWGGGSDAGSGEDKKSSYLLELDKSK